MLKILIALIIALALFSTTAIANTVTEPPHIGPEGGRFNKLHILKVEKLIENKLADKNLTDEERTEKEQLDMLLAVGKKASQWVEVINANRPPNQKLDLSNPNKTGGIPITNPNVTNTEILMKRYVDFLEKSSPLITDVITSSREYPTAPPLPDLEFIATLRNLDRIYQSTVRWSGAQGWLSWYITRAMYDVRGFLFLKGTSDVEAILKSFDKLSSVDQAKYTGWLLGLCRNGDFDSQDCSNELKKYVAKNTVYDFYTRFLKYGQSMYDLFFTIRKTRPEVKWNQDKTVLTAPFHTPERQDVKAWLKENVEDEWKTDSLKFVIDYQISNADIPRIQFKPGVTANVNEIAGNLITMESEYPIDTIAQKWVIRHEYGHVLGFTDCYLEFYDTREKAMIYYETDVDNLMCSRNGRLKPTHFEQLLKAYK